MRSQYSPSDNVCGKTLNKPFQKAFQQYTVETRCHEGPKDWQNTFAITRFRCIEVLFHIFYYYWGEECRSLYRGFTVLDVTVDVKKLQVYFARVA